MILLSLFYLCLSFSLSFCHAFRIIFSYLLSTLTLNQSSKKISDTVFFSFVSSSWFFFQLSIFLSCYVCVFLYIFENIYNIYKLLDLLLFPLSFPFPISQFLSLDLQLFHATTHLPHTLRCCERQTECQHCAVFL